MVVSPKEHIQKQILWYGYYEKKYVLIWEKFIGENSVVIDIGANIGYYSIVASQLAKHGSIYAFEPASQTYQSLLGNIQANDLANVRPLQLAAFSESLEKQLFISQANNIGMTGLKKTMNFGNKIEKVQAVALDEWVEQNKIGKIDLVKIDIEGAEFLALKGMAQTLKKSQPVLFIEISVLLNLYNNTPSELYDFLNKLNYKPYRVLSEKSITSASQATEDHLVIFIPGNYEIPASIEVQ
jgi:FkbM family methyltransferase